MSSVFYGSKAQQRNQLKQKVSEKWGTKKSKKSMIDKKGALMTVSVTGMKGKIINKTELSRARQGFSNI